MDMRGTPLTARNFLSMATILGWLHLTASWRGVLPHRSSTSRSTCIFYFRLYWILPSVRTDLAGLDEVFHAGWMVFHTSKMESRPPVVVSHVHVDSCQVGSLKSHLVTLRKRLELWNMMRLKREPVRQQTIAGQASGFAPRSFVLWDSSYHCCSRQSRCTKITRITNWFDCFFTESNVWKL